MNSKQLFNDLFKKRISSRVIFLPLICCLAAKLRQITVKEMFTNAGNLSNCQRDALRLLKHDAVINIFDLSLEAEALGCEIEWENENQPPRIVSHPLGEGKGLETLAPDFEQRGRMPIVLEATKRLTTVTGKQTTVIGVITGPLTLSTHLRGANFLNELKGNSPESEQILEYAGAVCLKTASMYCELNVDAILIVEEVIGKVDNQVMKKAVPVMESILNVVHYYEKPLLVLAHQCADKQVIDEFCSIDIDGLILDQQPKTSGVKDNSRKDNICLGESIPMKTLLSTPEQIRSNLMDGLIKGQEVERYFLSTEWDVPYDTPIQNIHEAIKVIQEEGQTS